MRRLSRAGFKKEFVRPAILPDWWDDECRGDAALLPDIEFRVARFLGVSVSDVRNPQVDLTAPGYASAQLRQVRDIDRDRLAPAIHAALRTAAATIRTWESPPAANPPPPDALTWRGQINRPAQAVTLDDLVRDLWSRGIPVIPLEVLPKPKFQGLAGIIDGRPVIVVGHRADQPGRAAFTIAHEAGHIAAGDCAAGQPVVDEVEEVVDKSAIEIAADRFATLALVGSEDVPAINGGNFRELARSAYQQERTTGADASAIIFSWAKRSGDYATASMAVTALYRGAGARSSLRRHFDEHVDLDAATDSDCTLLRCVFGDPDADAPAG